MPERINTLVIPTTGSGRIAVFARYRPKMPWKQVDACDSLQEAEAVAGRLELNKPIRCDIIDEWHNEQWGADAPVTPPVGDNP